MISSGVPTDRVTLASGSAIVLVSFSTSDPVRFSCFVPLLPTAAFLLRVSDCSLPFDLSDICLDFSEIGLLGYRLTTLS